MNYPFDLLYRVKPASYIGNEYNLVKKDPGDKIKVALAFPDTYEVGMSNLGFSIIYDIINRREDSLAERIFAPWVDMERLLRDRKIPLLTLESGRSISEFDILAFSISYELNYSNILTILDLCGLPIFFFGEERSSSYYCRWSMHISSCANYSIYRLFCRRRWRRSD